MIYLVLLLFTCFPLSLCSGVPVLLFGSERNGLRPALELVSEQNFGDIAARNLENAMIVAFVEEKLSSEHLTHCTTSSQSPCYPNLMEISPMTYYAKVDNPIEALRTVAQKKEYINVNAKGELDNDVSYEVGKVVFLHLDDNLDSSLNLHDSVVSKLYQDLSKLGKIMGIYTGSYATSLSRKARQATTHKKDNAEVEPKFFKIDKKVLIYFTELKKIDGKNEAHVNIVNAHLTSNSNTTSYGIELQDDKSNKLFFRINFDQGYWTLEDLMWNEEALRINPTISVPEGLSYYCGVSSRYTGTKKTTLVWSGLQVEPFKEGNPESFNDPWHCVGFTSAGIWSGLFVTFMLLGILSIGICWLMDINTMDRFDDPKGKTITINTTD